jgi:hypothetical protein
MGVSDVIGAAPWSHSTVSGWNCSGSDHFPFGDDALSAMMLSATITAAAAITTAVAARADSGGGQ